MSNNKANDKTKNKDPFDDEVILALFRKGARKYLDNDLLNDLPDNYEDIEQKPSELFNKEIEKIITKSVRKENNKHRIKHIPRIAAIVLVVVFVCSVMVMSVEAFRTPFLNLFINTREEITDIEIGEDQSNVEGIDQSDLFGYIPEGYELTNEDVQGEAAAFIFTNENKESIFIDRYLGEGSLGVDTEGAEYGEVLINDDKGFYSIKNGTVKLVFVRNRHTYLIRASIDLLELVKIAENIK